MHQSSVTLLAALAGAVTAYDIPENLQNIYDAHKVRQL